MFALAHTGIQSDIELGQVLEESFQNCGAEALLLSYIVSHFDVFEYRQEAWLFNKLANRFDDCVRGLTLVRERLLTQ